MALQFNQYFIKQHITSFSILVFLAAFAAVQAFKPRFMYNEDGSLRQFGIGFQRKTVVPVWLVAIIIAILSYLLVLYASTPLLLTL
jgi:hypothetical protein